MQAPTLIGGWDKPATKYDLEMLERSIDSKFERLRSEIELQGLERLTFGIIWGVAILVWVLAIVA